VEVIKRIDREVRELVQLIELDRNTRCDPEQPGYTECIIRKALVHVQLRKKIDRMLYQLAFEYVTSEDLEEKNMIEQVVEHLSQLGYITEGRWAQAVSNALRYRQRIDAPGRGIGIARSVPDKTADGTVR
jgi:predicted RNA-binding protein with EMAP domain